MDELRTSACQNDFSMQVKRPLRPYIANGKLQIKDHSRKRYINFCVGLLADATADKLL